MRKALFAVVVALAAAVAGVSLWRTSHRRPNVLIVSIDTLRADRLGCYGYRDAQTPVLDGLAASGLRFAQATTVATRTR